MQTILGANGVIGRELSKQLLNYTDQIRQVSRQPKKVNVNDTLMTADLLNYEDVRKAVAGSEVVYLVAGLKYDTKVWEAEWPKVMQHVISACKESGSKLVFFDNVYAYGLVNGMMTEDTPFNPCSRKGEVRAKIATMLLEEVKARNIQGMIVRAADFYGHGATLSMVHSTVVERLHAKKGPQWMGDPKRIHTFTYTPDAGRSVAVLGNTPSAFNQTWHALTSKERITGEELVRLACAQTGRPYAIQTLPKLGLRVLGLFIPMLRELVEMMYQFDADYVFDSTKFESTFNLQATSYELGMKETLRR